MKKLKFLNAFHPQIHAYTVVSLHIVVSFQIMYLFIAKDSKIKNYVII
jgi:hypothetical protein